MLWPVCFSESPHGLPCGFFVLSFLIILRCIGNFVVSQVFRLERQVADLAFALSQSSCGSESYRANPMPR